MDEAFLGSVTWLSMGGKPIPTWSYDTDAVHLLREWGDRFSWPLNGSGGPALPFLFRTLAMLWSFYAVYPWIVEKLGTVCGSDGGLAESSSIMIILYVPFLVGMIWWEFCAMRFVLPAQLLGIKGLTGNVNFYVWLMLAVGLTITMHMDVCTNSLFLAKVLKTSTCSSDIEVAWNHLMSNSSLPFLGWLKLWQWTLLAYTIMFMQLIHTLVYVFPLTEINVDLPKGSRITTFRTIGRTRQFVNSAVLIAAKAARMNTILSLKDNYLEAEIKTSYHTETIVGFLERGAMQVILYVIFESAIIMNLQGSSLAVNKYVTGKVDHVTTASIVISGIVGLKNLWTEVKLMSAIRKEVWPSYERALKAGKMEEKFKVAASRASSIWRRFLLAACLAAFMIIYAIVKAGAAAVCKHGLWNIKTGCLS